MKVKLNEDKLLLNRLQTFWPSPQDSKNKV